LHIASAKCLFAFAACPRSPSLRIDPKSLAKKAKQPARSVRIEAPVSGAPGALKIRSYDGAKPITTITRQTMKYKLKGKRIAILVADGFEQSELEQPRETLTNAGAITHIISPEADVVRGWSESSFGDKFIVDTPLRKARESDYDALLLPGGVMNPDRLRTFSEAVDFVRAFFDAGKPVAAICHGPQILIDADVVRDRTLTSHPSIKTDLINAGANWLDQEVVVDEGLVTSRRPADLPAFNEKMVEEIGEGVHSGHPN
jgi:protease I